MKMHGKRNKLLAALVVGSFCLGGATAQAASLLSANFNTVTRDPGCTQPLLASTNRSVFTILQNCAGELPSGTTQAGNGNVNVRTSTNVANTSTGNAGFNSFFTDNFLILGDASGVIGDGPEQGAFSITFPFALPTGALANDLIRVSFDWAFDGVDTVPAADTVSAAVKGSSSALSLLSLSSNTDLGDTGHFEQLIPVSAFFDGSLSLMFQLSEHTNNNTNTAFALDNVSVFAEPRATAPVAFFVPEPGSLALMGLALAGLMSVRKKRVKEA
jgi:PEP-CTERM motif